MRIFVGNLTVPIMEEELQQLFEPYGDVKRVQIIADQTTSQTQGFVEMPAAREAQAAIDGLQGVRRKDQMLTIHAAHWQWQGEDRS
jgi:RNA recognition motif-containing protein